MCKTRMGECSSAVITYKQILARMNHMTANGERARADAGTHALNLRKKKKPKKPPNAPLRCWLSPHYCPLMETLGDSSSSPVCVSLCLCVCVRFPGPAHRGPNHPDPVLVDVSVLVLPQLALLQTHQRTDALLCP